MTSSVGSGFVMALLIALLLHLVAFSSLSYAWHETTFKCQQAKLYIS